MQIIQLVIGMLIFIGFAFFAFQSWKEGEKRASIISVLIALLLSAPYFASSLLPNNLQILLLIITFIPILLVLVSNSIRRDEIKTHTESHQHRFDERDIMFSRYHLEPGSSEYKMYYSLKPENEKIDESLRALPGLFSMDSKEADFLQFASSKASFSLTEAVQDEVDGSRNESNEVVDCENITAYLKGLTSYLGAHSVGITPLRSSHVYSVSGRGTDPYGEPIPIQHDFAIAFTVEMSYEMMGASPKAPAVMESARQYVNAAVIALQLTYFIRSLGYRARAHIDGNYQVIAPLVARDAGLGEIGRMGLLMTRDLGPPGAHRHRHYQSRSHT